MASSAQKPDENRSKRKEMEDETSENPQVSSPDKADLALSEDSESLSNNEPLEKVLNEISKEILNFLSKYADNISSRATVDSSYVQELDEILEEARAIETHLKQKREGLKQRFTVVANTLLS